MQWKFWKRKTPGLPQRAQPDAAIRPRDVDATTPDASAPSPLLVASSTNEILGLQRMIGNQAVLRMMQGVEGKEASMGHKNSCGSTQWDEARS